MEIPRSETKPNPLKSEHLIEGVEPIMACVGTIDQYDGDLNSFILTGKDIDYYEPKEYQDKKYLGSEYCGYVISNIDSSVKFTEHLYDCTSVIAVGVDDQTGKNISFLTHQDTAFVQKEPFRMDLEKRIDDLKRRCKDGTIDIVIVGGKNTPDRIGEMHYKGAMSTLNNIVENTLGFEPLIICGPKETGGSNKYDNVYFDTEHRKLYVVRPKYYVVYNDSFASKGLDEVNER